MGQTSNAFPTYPLPLTFTGEANCNFLVDNPWLNSLNISVQNGATVVSMANWNSLNNLFTFGDITYGAGFQIATAGYFKVSTLGAGLTINDNINSGKATLFDASGNGLSLDGAGNVLAQANFKASTYGFTSANQAIDGVKTSYKVAHGLGRVPQKVWAELVCTTADANSGMAIGDILDTKCLFYNAAGTMSPTFGDGTYCEVCFPTVLLGHEGSYTAVTRGGGNIHSPSSFGNYVIVLHAI